MDIIAQDLAMQAFAAARSAMPSAFGLPRAPEHLLRWKKAIGRMRTAEGYRPLVAMVGDSKTAGVGTDPNAQFRAATSLPTRLAQILTARGLPAIAESMWGSAGTSAIPASLYDPRRSGFSGWSLYGGVSGDGGIGGELSLTTGTSAGIFTPSIPVDRVRLFYKQGEGGIATASATVTVDADATVRATLPGSASPSYTRSPAVDLGALASHAIKVNPAGTAPFYLAGMLAWNSAAPAIDIANIAAAGVKASWQTTSARLKWLEALAPDLTIINIGSNDMLSTGATDIAAFTASVQATITRAKLSGDVMLLFPAIGRDTGSAVTQVLVSDAQRAPFRTALAALAASNGCAFVDEQALFGGRDMAQSAGLFADSLHENGSGTVMRADNLATLMMS
ncbi:MAG TPA: SGNH/GDSL hydrolase family protein [Sphingobium sp.]|uniref:SGNH/GDSL hydrolase family protein n=1 Tax=Sphingobium sp. TaxID=1912891 RepID=UPI002ED491CD